MPHDPAHAHHAHYEHAHYETVAVRTDALRPPAAVTAPPPASLLRLSLGARLGVAALALLVLWTVVLLALR